MMSAGALGDLEHLREVGALLSMEMSSDIGGR
jgi:hypothetical protein